MTPEEWIHRDDPAPPKQTETDVWAVCELMGHVKLAGRLSEVERFGGTLARLDVPYGEGFLTKYFGASAVYQISFVTEAVARHVAAKGTSPAPVQPWDFPKQLPAAGIEAEPPKICRHCPTPANPACDNDRCTQHCDERCDTHCRRSMGEADDDDASDIVF